MIGFSSTTNTHPDGRPAKRRCRREGTKWTRSGCLTCKRRRKRCDEAKPNCNSCSRLGIACEGYGSMWAAPLGPSAQVFRLEGPAKRRRTSLSPASPAVSTPLSESPEHTMSVADEDSMDLSSPTEQDDSSMSDESAQVPFANDGNQLIPSPAPSRLISHLSNLDTHYLQYHTEKGSKLLANLETDENPLRSLIIPRALSSPLLMNALCALSAIHFSNRAPYSWSAPNEGASYYIETMRGLRTALMTCQARNLPNDAALAIAMLCKYELVRGSVKQWTVHMDALQKLVFSKGGFAQLEPDTAEFIRGFLVYANSVAKLTNCNLITHNVPDLDISSPRNLDIYIGYTEDILKTCVRISDLPRLSSDPIALTLEIESIDTHLRTWTSSDTTYIIPRGMSEAALARLRLVAESFRDAAYIYLHSILERMMISSQSPSSPASPVQYPARISVPKPHAISNLLSRLKAQPVSNNCEFSALTFPLFIAGCEASPEDEEDRALIMQTLTALEGNFGIGNVKRAKQVLGVVWNGNYHGKGRHWVDVLEGLGWDLILA
ncbi:fungal-specific transcription factor domain-containing protein [Aspergillus unguis]